MACCNGWLCPSRESFIPSGGALERTCQVRNRMREIRTSGSVRGEEGNRVNYSTCDRISLGKEEDNG